MSPILLICKFFLIEMATEKGWSVSDNVVQGCICNQSYWSCQEGWKYERGVPTEEKRRHKGVSVSRRQRDQRGCHASPAKAAQPGTHLKCLHMNRGGSGDERKASVVRAEQVSCDFRGMRVMR